MSINTEALQTWKLGPAKNFQGTIHKVLTLDVADFFTPSLVILVQFRVTLLPWKYIRFFKLCHKFRKEEMITIHTSILRYFEWKIPCYHCYQISFIRLVLTNLNFTDVLAVSERERLKIYNRAPNYYKPGRRLGIIDSILFFCCKFFQ